MQFRTVSKVHSALPAFTDRGHQLQQSFGRSTKTLAKIGISVLDSNRERAARELMTTGQQAIERIAEVSRLSIYSVTRAARALREAGEDLWPTSKRGPQKNPVPTEAHHLSSIVIALASPGQESREQSVRDYRAMRFVGSPQWLLGKEDFQDLNAFERCVTFGEALDLLISNLNDFACDSSNPDCLYGPIKVFLSNRRMASISREWRGRNKESPSHPEMMWISPTVGLDDPNNIAMEIMGTIRFPMLQALADLLPAQDNQQEQPPSPSGSSASTTADPGNENAALPQAAPRRPRKRVAQPMNDPSGIVGNLSLLDRERQHVVRGHPQMGALPLGVTKYDKHASYPSPAEARGSD